MNKQAPFTPQAASARGWGPSPPRTPEMRGPQEPP